MKKSEAYEIFQKLFDIYSRQKAPQDHASFIVFESWLQTRNQLDYFKFKAPGGARHCVEGWFKAYFSQ
ncbi:hypothetical protein K6W36_07400 [Acetobacter senegalensis]|uniref:hypothetical protein n=1 Tax=Acetobacter senegalensis TaxID=446692 RepID=UPI001EDB0AA9|nr:hypothetical protein [Acetobacter senegalensis]MCG4260410.1 hypothetical protein [Acetobacter senegalensis]